MNRIRNTQEVKKRRSKIVYDLDYYRFRASMNQCPFPYKTMVYKPKMMWANYIATIKGK